MTLIDHLAMSKGQGFRHSLAGGPPTYYGHSRYFTGVMAGVTPESLTGEVQPSKQGGRDLLPYREVGLRAQFLISCWVKSPLRFLP